MFNSHDCSNGFSAQTRSVSFDAVADDRDVIETTESRAERLASENRTNVWLLESKVRQAKAMAKMAEAIAKLMRGDSRVTASMTVGELLDLASEEI